MTEWERSSFCLQRAKGLASGSAGMVLSLLARQELFLSILSLTSENTVEMHIEAAAAVK